MEKTSNDWFAHWFDSPYYHLLYRHRNDAEAHFFIDNLLGSLRPVPGAEIMDLACSKGRHARYIAQKGYRVTGLDLSPQSIRHARQYESDRLRFFVHDMRRNFGPPGRFDYVLNFFTSFGYFGRWDDNLKVLQAARHALKPDGVLVIDFLNYHKTAANLVGGEEKEIEGVSFSIRREIRDGYIYKHIGIEDGGQCLQFVERVQALQLPDFGRLFEASGFALAKLWGNYALQPFDVQTSDRLILQAKKVAV